MILREWYRFVQGTLRNHISDVTRKKVGLATNSKPGIFNISEITSYRILIWRFKPTFLWSRNQINTLCSMADHYYVCKGTKKGKLQDGRQFCTLFRKMCHNFCSSCNKKVSLVFKPKSSCMRIPIEMKLIWLGHIWYYIMTSMTKKQLVTIAKSNIDDKLKSCPSNTFFLEFTPTSFGKESNKGSFKHNRTLSNAHDNI